MSTGMVTTKDGTQIFYKDWGTGRPVVFSYGWPLNADAWDELSVPGSPYAVVLSADGEVLSKGTFNSLYQLESLLVAATRPVSA